MVILVHRLRGEPLFVNADLIESIEATPDTLLTLVDGRKAMVTESPEQVVGSIVAFRAAVLVAAEELSGSQGTGARLTVLPGKES